MFETRTLRGLMAAMSLMRSQVLTGPGHASIDTAVSKARASKSSSQPGYMKPFGIRTKGYAHHGNGKRR